MLAPLPHRCPQTPPRPALPVRQEWIPSRRLGQKLERPPARVRGHPVRARRDDDGRGRLIRNQPGKPAKSRVVFQPAALGAVLGERNASCELVEVPTQAGVELKVQIRCSRREEQGATAPHRNMRAATAEEQAGRRPLRASSCGASNVRASIYACKAFNTEERAGSIGQASGRTTCDSGVAYRGIRSQSVFKTQLLVSRLSTHISPQTDGEGNGNCPFECSSNGIVDACTRAVTRLPEAEVAGHEQHHQESDNKTQESVPYEFLPPFVFHWFPIMLQVPPNSNRDP